MVDFEAEIAALRIEFSGSKLDEKEVDPDPFLLFRKWFDEALKSKIPEANAMSLATVNEKGKPSVRIVLLKDIEGGGFVFYTNYRSRKCKEMKSNPNATLCFYWQALGRQIRVEGKIVKTTKSESDAYFDTRPEGSKIGAWASPQSKKISSRKWLEKRVADLVKKFGEGKIPRPGHWGGYCLVPKKIEFWQGRENRLHDRILFERNKKTGWKIFRLAP